MELLSKKEIEELTENYPLYSQDDKKGETKVFNLRLKPDCELFDYFINY